MIHLHHPSCCSKYSKGFSLIELMISIGIGTVVLLGLTVMFSVNTSNQIELEQTVRKLENIRYALDTLSEDVMHAGYFSDFNPNTLPQGVSYQTPNPCNISVAATTDQGWSSGNGTVAVQLPVPVMGIAKSDTTTAPCLTNRKTGTAAVVVRHAETNAGTSIGAGAPTGVDATTASNLYIQVSACNTDTNTILVAKGPAASFILKNATCTAVSTPVRRLAQRIYYIATCNDCSPSDGIPTLKRHELINGAEQIASIAEGIEDLQLEYGIDAVAPFDGQPESFVANAAITAYSANNWANVVNVRLHLLARNTQTTAGYTDNRTYALGPDVSASAPSDGFKRSLMTTTVRLNNVAGRRE